MRNLLVLTLVVLGFATTSLSAGACSASGRYCSYPTWAADAFVGGPGR